MEKLYTIKAGTKAKEIICDKWLNPDDIKIIVGASGGPKWLVLAGIDDLLPDFIKQRKSTSKIHLIGSSIGSWRLAAYASSNPSEALKNLEFHYKTQKYIGRPTAKEVSDESMKILNSFLTEKNRSHIANNSLIKLHVITALSKGIGSSDNSLMLGSHLGFTFIFNMINRSLTKGCFKGVNFTTSTKEIPFDNGSLIEKNPVKITSNNLREAILASGSIPLVMEGIKNIEGAPQGTYRDGGLVHYHPDLKFNTKDDELVLYPHFYEYIVPGWFDKSLPKTRYHQLPKDNVVLISPSNQFIDKLELGRIPDRTDFKHFYQKDDERIKCWDSVTNLSREMAKELFDDISDGLNKDSVKLLS